MNQSMTPKEHFIAAINHQEVDYMPTCGPSRGFGVSRKRSASR